MNRKITLLSTLAFAWIATPAFAHMGHSTLGLTAGLAHPFLGWDHLLAMLTVGILAVRAQPPVRWSLPLLFVAMLALGAVFGIFGGPWAGLEGAVAGSLVLLGLLLVWGRQLAAFPLYALIAATAWLHGMAHGAEVSGAWGSYLVGMLAASLALHLGGVALGKWSATAPSRAEKIYGGASATAGLLLLAGIL
ncbi:MAG: HupE/UreJ family protein [bacterium]|nr:HupE/UreJ family protein [bacterium]